MLPPSTVAISCSETPWEYPTSPPFNPHEAYPELREDVPTREERNINYALLRQLMHDLEMDIEHFSSM